MIVEGPVCRLGDDIDTDVIIPGRYLAMTDPRQLAEHVFEGMDSLWAKRMQPGRIIVAGRNFGCGSSREHAPLALKGAGVSCVVAASFARIFFRNAINLGLPILVSPEVAYVAQGGENMVIDTEQGSIRLAGKIFPAEPYPAFLQELIGAGGLVDWVRTEIHRRNRKHE